jgi:hypothetical protein
LALSSVAVLALRELHHPAQRRGGGIIRAPKGWPRLKVPAAQANRVAAQLCPPSRPYPGSLVNNSVRMRPFERSLSEKSRARAARAPVGPRVGRLRCLTHFFRALVVRRRRHLSEYGSIHLDKYYKTRNRPVFGNVLAKAGTAFISVLSIRI